MTHLPSLSALCLENVHSVDTLLGPDEDSNNLPLELQQLILSNIKYTRYEILIANVVNIDELRSTFGRHLPKKAIKREHFGFRGAPHLSPLPPNVSLSGYLFYHSPTLR